MAHKTEQRLFKVRGYYAMMAEASEAIHKNHRFFVTFLFDHSMKRDCL